MNTKELIEVLERAKRLPGARGWGVDVGNEVIKRLEELEELKVGLIGIKFDIEDLCQ